MKLGKGASDQYTVLSLLGSGTQGEVFAVRVERDGSLAALKLVRRRSLAALSSLRREFHARRRLAQKNLVRFYEFDTAPEGAFFTMELVNGAPFDVWYAELAEAKPSLRIEAVLHTALQVLAGFMALEQAGMVHGDIKPANVLVDSAGHVTIVDFGLALASREEDGVVAGSPRYMAPEVAFGARATIQADLHALGVMIYEVLAGFPPFSATSFSGLMLNKYQRVPTRLTLPDLELEYHISRWLSPEPAERGNPADAIQTLSRWRGAAAPPRSSRHAASRTANIDAQPVQLRDRVLQRLGDAVCGNDGHRYGGGA